MFMHERKWFNGIGMLEYLSAEEFHSGPWVVSELSAKDQYGHVYCVVRNTEKFDIRYMI